VVENTTFGSGFQIAAHSSIESSSDGSWSAVSQYSIVSYSPRPNRWTPTSRISSVTKRKTSSSGAVQSKPPSTGPSPRGRLGEAIVQETCNGSVAQQWTVALVSSTKVHLVNRSSNLCLDARGGATNGTPIEQWTCDWISNENWSFGITNNLLSSGVSNTFSHCVATPGVQDGLAMELRFCDGDPAQLWSRPNG
jgi:Ricin-type beta-trefoil lectin domain